MQRKKNGTFKYPETVNASEASGFVQVFCSAIEESKNMRERSEKNI